MMTAPAHDPERVVRERGCPPSTLEALAGAGQLFAVVDAAGKPDVYAELVRAGADARPLYAGEAESLYAGIAPWLVALDVTRCAWVAGGPAAEDGWGVFVIARAPADAVRRQLRKLLTVRLPKGQLVRFRFYDARVLAPFLAACTAAELDFVFGPVAGYAAFDALTQRVRVWDRPAHPAMLPRQRLAVQAPRVVPAPEGSPHGRARRPWAVAVGD